MSIEIKDHIFDTKLKFLNFVRDPTFSNQAALNFLQEQVSLSDSLIFRSDRRNAS